MYPNRPENNFSPALLPDHLAVEVAAMAPDLLHLHWLGAGFLRVETLGRFDKPLIWTLHDSWAFTGGCHVPYDCTRYRHNCGECPILGSRRSNDLSRWTWKRKARAWRNLNLTVVAPSRWLADCARESSLFRNVRVEVIPNGLDIDAFRPADREQSRASLGLPQDRKIILFGAVHGSSDPNKGFQLLTQALQLLAADRSDAMAVVFGSDDFPELPDLPMPLVSLGTIHDDSVLAALYSAADVFVLPSMLENLPNTVLEAMACGTPCVAFRQGGVPDLIDHQECGYLAQPYDTGELARGIAWVLEDRRRHAELARRARQKVVADFDLHGVAARYRALYHELLPPG